MTGAWAQIKVAADARRHLNGERVMRPTGGWREIHRLAVAGLLLRLLVAFSSDQLQHPDEIFQYLEQAHRLVFGYGYIPWEYRFGIRSWVLPGFISSILYLCKALGIEYPAVYINLVKAIFCVLSTSLVYSAYVVGKQICSENAGKLAALFCCCWYELLYYAFRATPEVVASYAAMAALAMAVVSSFRGRSLLFGLACGLAVILRIQYIPVVAGIVVVAVARWKGKGAAAAFLIFALVVAAAGLVDTLTWGTPFVSYYNNFLFNSVYKAADLFGKMNIFYYPGTLTIASAGLFFIAGLLGMLMIRRTWLPMLLIGILGVVHLAVAHKEYRFVWLIIPLFLVLLAVVTDAGIGSLQRVDRRAFFYRAVVAGFLAVSSLGLFQKLPMQEAAYPFPMLEKRATLRAYLFLHDAQDVQAVLNIYSGWARTGGYYYLHLDIPIYLGDHLKSKNEKDWSRFVSHIVCRAGQAAIPGFESVHRIGDLEIRKNSESPTVLEEIGVDYRNVLQKGIDDRYTPTVRKAL